MTEELPHIRCIECGKVLANKWQRYKDMLGSGIHPQKALTDLGFTRYCCRMWMMNPFKVPSRSDKQIDPRDTGLEKQMETLTIATAPQPPMGALQSMQNPESVSSGQVPEISQPGQITAYTVVPETSIDLPPIPEVDLPAIPALTQTTETQETKSEAYKTGDIVREYKAW
jgi:DNA-directed RNA polymerase subunit N